MKPPQRDALYTAAAAREGALAIKRSLDSKDITPDEAARRWAALPQGRDHTPTGSTEAERNASLSQILDTLSDEAAVTKVGYPEQTLTGRSFAGGKGTSGH